MADTTVELQHSIYHYTVFPNLQSTIDPHADGDLNVPTRTNFKLPKDLSTEALILSWAFLLRGYAGFSVIDTAVFRVDDKFVCVDFNDNKIQTVEVVDDDLQKCSALYFENFPKEPVPQIYLITDLSSSCCSLVASLSIVHFSHLETLSYQLSHIISDSSSFLSSPSTPFPSASTSHYGNLSVSAPFSSPPQGVLETEGFLLSEGLSVLNPSPEKLPGSEILHELVDFAGNIDATALDYLHSDGKSRTIYTYAELDFLSTCFAGKLSELMPSNPEGGSALKVSVLLSQSPALYIALLGILKIGAAFVPLNLDAPAERIRFVVNDVGASIVVTESGFADRFSWENCPKTVIFGEEDLCVSSVQLQPNHHPVKPVDPKSPAYIMYTSGSTGTPKGVTISHSAATQSLLAHERHIPTFSRFLQFASPTFDVFVFEMFFPLKRGKTLVGCDRGVLLAKLPGVINQMDVDAAELTPTVVDGLLGKRKDVPGLKVLLTIGEMLTRGVVEEFGGSGEQSIAVLQGMYGPTEAAIHCTLATGFQKNWKLGDVGVPLDTVSAFILAPPSKLEDVEVLPVGWAGELAIGGHQLADGYLNRPELTMEVFFESEKWGRMYRTGDLARFLPGGRIECLGRISAGQVKLRGQRIELGEVEEVVSKIPGAKGAVASIVEGSMVVYVGGGIEKNAVEEICRKWLPGFMVPSDIVIFDELPRLPSGKADRKMLDTNYSMRETNVSDSEMNEAEITVANAIESLLGTRPSKSGSLIAGGLDSIQAIRLTSILRSKGLKIEVVDVLKRDCVEGIAKVLSSQGNQVLPSQIVAEECFARVREAGWAKISPSLAEEVDDIIPCTPMQEAMLTETARDPRAYCNWILLEVSPSLDDSSVELAFRCVVEKNEILRTGFIALDDGFAQVIWKHSRKQQFSTKDTVEREFELSFEEMMEPPFSVTLVREDVRVLLSFHLHHAVYDGWCWEQILSDFGTLLEGKEVNIERPQFREVVAYELGRSNSSKENLKVFWKGILEGLEGTKLPNFHGHSSAKPGIQKQTLKLKSPRSDYEIAARNMGVSPQVILQAAWAYLLSSYIGSPDVVFGTVLSGRTIAMDGVEDLIGPTILTLPVRVGVDDGEVIRDFMRSIQYANRKILENSDLPLREIRKACGIEGVLFDSLLVWQQTLKDVSTIHGDGEMVKQVDNQDRLEFSLLIEIEPGVDRIELKATYQSAILPETQVELLLQQLDQLVSGIISRPNDTLHSLLSFLENSVLSIENPQPLSPSTIDYPSLASLVEHSVAQNPEAIAIEFANDFVDGRLNLTRVTYAELNRNANTLAHHLISLGVLPNDLVCVCMEKSPKVYTSILAILKTGAGYLPLAPETPTKQLNQILEDAEAKYCLTTSNLVETLGILGPVLVLDIEQIDANSYPETNPVVEIDPAALAYAIFTYGDTEVPRGVLIENRNIVSNLLVLKDIYPTTFSSKMLQFCSVAHNMSVSEIFFTWSMGMCLCSGAEDTLLLDIEGVINAFGVTHLSMTPAVAALVYPPNVPAVTFLVVAGEAATWKAFNDWAGKGLYQGYGPSEAVNICTVRPRVQKYHHINNIGAPLANSSAFVIKETEDRFDLIPRGGIGEFAFGGAQVGRGYLKMPEITGQKWLAHPTFGRIYRTGDIGRLLPDGSLKLVGRRDSQAKVQGYRVELTEINSVLLGSASVIDAFTLPIKMDGLNAHKLVSFVVLVGHMGAKFSVLPNKSIRSAIPELFAELAKSIPAYMVPFAIIPVTALPMTPQGKTDEQTLRRMFIEVENILQEFTGSAVRDEDEEGWTDIERQVAQVIADVARVTVDEVRRNTSIFKLGLDSISAIQLSTRITGLGFSRLDISQIMRNPTTSALAVLLENEKPIDELEGLGTNSLEEFAVTVRSEVLEQLEYSEGNIAKILPCTPLQEAMLSEKKGTGASAYYNHTILTLKADPVRLKGAWNLILERHDIMKTCFGVTSHPRHAFAQVILKEYQLPWSDMNVDTDEDILTSIDKYITSISSTMETKRPPYAFALFKSTSRNTLVMSFHHSLYDGFAMELLLEDVKRAYNGLELHIRSPFDLVLGYMEDLDLVKADNFWKILLTGLEPSLFPDLTGRSSTFKTNLVGMTSQSITCSRSLDLINNGCRILLTSLLALGQTAWARLLASYTGDTDLCFGNVVSGRTIPIEGVEDIIAPCFNTIPIRIKLKTGSTNQSIMEDLQRLNAEVLPFQHTSLRRIMTTLRTEGQSLFDTLFILQHDHESSLEELWEEMEDRGEMDFSIVVELVPSRNKNTLNIVLHFRRNTILEEHAHLLLQQLDSAIASSLDNPLGLVSNYEAFDISLLSSANEKPKTLEGTQPGFLHSEFERHARENSDRIALEYLDDAEELSSWSFQKLNQLANQVAHYLISLGVGRDEAVPLCLEKSPLFYTCVLGVLKAGAAFTPIDPSLPPQRKHFMIQELGAKIVLANSKTARNLSLPCEVMVVNIEDSGFLSSQPTNNPEIQDLSPSHLAYRLYTSGSTGQPKAVSMEIKSAVQTFRASKPIIPWKNDSRLLQFAATTFDMCYYDCFMAWSYGFTLCSAAKSHLLGDLEATIRKLKISLLDLTPAVASTLHEKTLPEIELLYCIGETMPRNLVDDWAERCVNSYGPTEAAMCCTITPVRKDIKAANIGRPFITTSFFVLSREGSHVVPIFGSGELCIGGPQLAREYHKNTELTNSQFIRFGKDVVYRTGDIVRMLADGTFEFIGRADDQVKIRGLRVELDEINEVLKGSHESVKDAVTLVLKHTEDAKDQLVSFLALKYRKQYGIAASVIPIDATAEKILSTSKQGALSALPRYMVPGIILVLDHMPLSAAGKVDKRALGNLFRQQDIQLLGNNANVDDESVWTDNERKIRNVFSEISQVSIDQISRSSTIYEIGLDSISAAQVAMQLKKIGIAISVLDILERPSIDQLSHLLSQNRTTQDAIDTNFHHLLSDFRRRFFESMCAETGISIEKIGNVYPCTPAQEGMLSQFLRSNGELYFNHILLKLPIGIDLVRLQKAWQSVFESHEILRAGFVGVDDACHSFATVIYQKESANLPWSTVTYERDLDSLLGKYKKTNALNALENLHLPPWNLTLFRGTNDSFLLYSANHALYDAQSLQIILDNVASYYSGNETPKRPHFAAVLGSIISHTADVEVIEKDKAFWLKKLQGSNISRFPNLCPVRVQNANSHVLSIESTWRLSQIENACQSMGVSVHSVGQAAWAKILCAYSGETAVNIGIVLSGRTGINDAENTPFPCLVILPLFCLLTGTNHELVLAIQESNTSMLKHQYTPLKSIQRWFEHPEQSFFDSIFVYQKTRSNDERSQQSLSWEVATEEASVDYAISLEMEPIENDRLLYRATCRNSVIPIEQTQLLLRQFDAAVLEILENSSKKCTDFSSYSPDLLSCTPAKVDEIPSDICLLHKFVEKHRKCHPDRIAFEFATAIDEDSVTKKSWTYTQLDEEGNKIANYLLRLGVKTGNIIGVCFEKCPEASFAMLGILKAGCAFMALDYNAPIDRKAFIVEDSGTNFILTMDKFAAELRSNLKVGVVCLEGDSAVSLSSTETPVVDDLGPEDLCYCLYTSGTTGTPKGCELTHENAVQAMLSFQRLFSPHWDSESRFLQFASFHFDVSVLEQYWSWSVGVCVTSAPRDLIFQDLALTIRQLQITHLDLTPSLAALLQPEDVPSLCRGVFITGGEQLKQEILDTWGANGVIYNGYGPTEVTIGCTMYPRVPANGKPSNIGPQFDNVGSFVLHPGTDQPVLRGAIGELCVSGKLVGRGYLNRPKLTNEKFQYLEDLNERIYRTGDLVRILHDGTFDFAGRADDQVKLRGQRLEIGEINEILKQADPRIRAVATLVLRHPKQQKDQLVSFIVLDKISCEKSIPVILDSTERTGVISLLSSACKRKLPVYMVPTHFLPISAMPLSVNNKVDNKKLITIYEACSLEILQQISRQNENEGIWTETEQQLRAILAEITGLQLSEISRSSTIFELGLDSVSVVGLARRLNKRGFLASSVSLVMQNPGLVQLATVLVKTDSSDSQEIARLEAVRQKIAAFANKNSFDVSESLGLRSEEIKAINPCSALQEGMIARFLDSEKPLYYNSFSMTLDEPTDVDVLRAACYSVVQSTDILRTCFCETPDGYAQIILKNPRLEWEGIVTENENVQELVTSRMDQHVAQNNDLHQPPVYCLLIQTPSKRVLVLNIFHALYDGNSLPLILNDIQRAYHGIYQKRTCQFEDTIGYILSIDSGRARDFWKKILHGVRTSQFPQLCNPPSEHDHTSQLRLDTTADEIEGVCKKLNCTPQSVFQAAWSSVLSSYLGSQTAFGVVVSGRSLSLDNVEEAIGPLFNTIPCSLDVNAAPSWKNLVQQAQYFNSESIPYHHTPLRLIHKWLNASTEKPLFDTLFVYQKDAKDKGAPIPSLWEISESSAIADYPLSLEVEQSSNGNIVVSIVAKGSISSEEVSLGLLRRFQQYLQAIIQSPDKKPSIASEKHLKPATPVTGGVIANVFNREFEWNSQSKTIRTTIATLADIEETNIDEDSSIFELGLDSIEAIKLSSRLRRHNIQLPVSAIMRNPTIRKMRAYLGEPSSHTKDTRGSSRISEFEQQVRQALETQQAKLKLDNIQAIYPTTPLQEAMIAETIASDYRLYFNHDVLELESWVDIQLLERAWKSVIQQNEILRTSFFAVSEMGLDSPHAFGQMVHKSPQARWNDLGLPFEEDATKRVQEVMRQAPEKVDLLEEPPLCITIVQTSKAKYLVLSISHALYDGWSMNLLHKDVQRAYFDCLESRPSPRLLLESIFNADPDGSGRFWKHVLHGSCVSNFPILVNQVAQETATHRFERSSKVGFPDVQNFCKQMGATTQALGQTCWGLVLAHYLKETDVLFGTVLSGREFDGAEDIMFPAMNTVPVRAIVHGSYKEMLRYMQDNGANVLKHQNTPLRQIQRLFGAGGQRLFDTLFIYQRRSDVNDDSQINLWHSVDGAYDVEYNVCVEMERAGDSLVWRTACKSTVINAEGANTLLDVLDSLLAHIISNPDHPAIIYHEDGFSIGNTPMVKSDHQSSYQITLNGIRVDLENIAGVITKARSEIEKSVALVFEENGSSFLVAFVVVFGQDSGHLSTLEGSIEDIAKFSRQNLPHWSVPTFIIPIQDIPYTDGIVDQNRLQSVFSALSIEERNKYTTDRDQNTEWSLLELAFRQVFSKASKLPEEEINRTQTIFHMGLDSLSAIGVSAELRKRGISLSVADILRAATIERMAIVANLTSTEPIFNTKKVLEESLSKLPIDRLLSRIARDDIEYFMPATSGQTYMMAAWKNSNYKIFMPTLVFKCSRVNLASVLSAWVSLVQQEPILRTTFTSTDSNITPLLQLIFKDPPLQYEWHQVSSATNESLIQFLALHEQRKPVDLALPPVRLTALNSSTETVLFLTIHHALYDGVSLPLLISKFQYLLQSHIGPSLPTHSPKGPTFSDVVAFTVSRDHNQQRLFWSNYLHGSEPTLVPISHPQSSSFPNRRIEVFKPHALGSAKLLETQYRQKGLTLQSVVLAAYAKVFSNHLNLNDVTFGIYLANRHLLPELSSLAAPTLNIVPLRVHSARNKGLIRLAEQVQKDLVEIGNPENSVVGLWEIKQWTGVDVDCFFNFLKFPDGSGEELDIEGQERIVLEAMNVEVQNVSGNAGRAQKEEVFPENQCMRNIKTNLDIEVAIRGDAIDIGVFSFGEYIDEDEAASFIERMCENLVENAG